MNINESGENYLETILLLEQQKGSVRSVDIAAELMYSKPSVSRAMRILKDAGLIHMGKDGTIRLTETGKIRANRIYERHRFITEYLHRALGVDKLLASEDACRIEHVISEESFEKIRDWVEKDKGKAER